MKKWRFLLLLALAAPGVASGQFRLLSEDSLRQLLRHQYQAASPMRNSAGLELLNRILPGNPGFDSLREILVSETEISRNRGEMCRVNLEIANVYQGFSQLYAYAVTARPFIERGAAIAEESGLDLYKAIALLRWARFDLTSAELQRALDCNNQAIALALATGNDSLISACYSSLSYTNDYLENKLSRFQALLAARSYAEKSNQLSRKLQCLLDLAEFYRDADQMEKSRDFYSQVVTIGEREEAWDFVVDARRGLGMTYRLKHLKALAVAAYDSALDVATRHSLQHEKVNTTIALLNYYFNEETPDIGLAYLAAHPELGDFIKAIGVGYQINKIYAIKYEQKGNYDSALYFVRIAAPFELNQPQNFFEKLEFSRLWARILDKSGRKEECLQHLLAAKNYADSSGDLQRKCDVSHDLDSAYLTLGDYKNAFTYYSRYNSLRDTLETMGKQKDLMNAEIEDAGKRAEAEKVQQAEELRRRDNLEYMGITAAIATLFVILMVLGVFRMSVSVIKGLGFFAFIFLFEFITLLLDKQIHELTHGEPWKVLAIKIVLIAMLLPLHHYLEHRAILFLTSKAHMLRERFGVFHKSGRSQEEKGPDL